MEMGYPCGTGRNRHVFNAKYFRDGVIGRTRSNQ
jgi:hypothetical protein